MVGAMTLPTFPSGACDTHIHVYDGRYPNAPTTVLDPPDAGLDEYRGVQAALGLQRAVVVQPTTYGLDNSCQLAAVAELGDDARAVVVVDEHTDDDELARLTRLGARGARFHLLPGGAVGKEALAPVAARIAAHGWHIQLQMNGRDLIDDLDALIALPCPLVVDHVGRYMPPVEPGDERFGALLTLIETGRCWVKLSAPYESTTAGAPTYPTVARLARLLIRRAPHRMLWASNWPHPGQPDPLTIDQLARLADDWLPDDDLQQRVLVDNPVELYGFAPIHSDRQETPP
jgi:D-galactarolactone isomerase